MYNVTDVVKNLLLINVVIYVALHLTFLGSYNQYFVLYPFDHPNFHPVQIITHMFNHGGMGHLFFNMLTLFFFGPNVERVWGPKRFLFYYLVCGLGSVLLHVLYGGGSAVLGASGAISGVLVAFAFLYPNARVMLLIPPIPLRAKYLVALLLAYDFYMGLTGANTGIAHFAHIGGAAVGALLVLVFRKKPNFMS